jgi:hypothetical protein
VPAAFARRPVRPVPAPPANPYAEFAKAAQESSAIDPFTGHDLTASAPLDPPPAEPAPQPAPALATAPFSNQVGPTFLFPERPAPPAPPAAKPRADTLDFLRSPAELEKILT